MKNTGLLKVTPIGDLDILLTRVFDAPRHLVFDALTKPDLVKRWFGPHGWSCTECEIDLRVGGAWRYLLIGPNGRSMTMHGVYRELAPPDRMVHTETINNFPESIVTTRLTEENGRTTLNATVASPSKETRDAVLHSGMERGAGETYDRLAELLVSQAAGETK
jgi:uncharacterized protein YndB with AHSA1/START domain